MTNTNESKLHDFTLVTPVTTLELESAVDHPGTWLEILEVLPCRDDNDICLSAEFSSGHRIKVRAVEVAAPVLDTAALRGSRRFCLQFLDSDNICGAEVELGVKADADHVDVSLALLSADAALLNTPVLARALVLALPSILKTAASDVISVVHRALSPDLSDTTVALLMIMPDARFAQLLAETVEELGLQLQGLAEQCHAFRPTCRGWLVDAPEFELQTATPSKAKTALSTAQRLALGLNLCTLREALDLKQLEVAHQALGFAKSHAAVSRLERGILSEVETDRLERLAAFFYTDVPALLSNRLTSGEPTLPGESAGLSPFDPNCDFTPSANYGKRITLARTSAGLSVQGLAKKLGHLSDGTVRGWESELTLPRRTSFIDLGLALEAPVSWMMFGRRVDTPSRGLALRLTGMQKLYGLTNAEVAALMEPSDDTQIHFSTVKQIHRMSVGNPGAPREALQRLAAALQVPVDWLSPPDLRGPVERERAEIIAQALYGDVPSLSGLSKSALKLVTDLIDLIGMGVVTDDDVRELRTDMVTRFTTPYLKSMRLPSKPTSRARESMAMTP